MTRRGLRQALIASSLVRFLRTSVTFVPGSMGRNRSSAASSAAERHGARVLLPGTIVSESPVAVRGVGERGPLGPPEEKERS